jgi:WhiB family redox-sensing transcriptional regulator
MTAKFNRPDNAEWMQLAACKAKGTDPEIFFPTHDASPSLSKARKVCAACFVKRDCLAYALAIEGGQPAKTRDGVYAGTTGGERYRLYQRGRGRTRGAAA